ncbi:hypothetical protein KK475_28920, partial [Klebsiella pneumoniae]|uniref:hypothetical protein n=1 Tax=Klebsiella pneumoniae TaxID=573 RepID=UPI001BE08B6A
LRELTSAQSLRYKDFLFPVQLFHPIHPVHHYTLPEWPERTPGKITAPLSDIPAQRPLQWLRDALQVVRW